MNVLSIDGGGIRGIIPAMILEEIEKRSNKPISKIFDFIAGASTGGIIAVGLAVKDENGNPKFSAKDLLDLYVDDGENIFDKSIWKAISSLGNLTDERYSNKKFKSILEDRFGITTLKDTLIDVMVPCYETERRIPWFFKSKHAKNPEREKDYNFKLSDIALATSSAPTYFEPHKVSYKNDDYLSLIDGGIFANNPSMCAYVDAISLFNQKSEDINIVSLGTGISTKRLIHDNVKDWGLSKWARPIINCALDGVSDTVHYQLKKIMPTDQYIRIQGDLGKTNHKMDDASPENIKSLQRLGEQIIRDENDKINAIINGYQKFRLS